MNALQTTTNTESNPIIISSQEEAKNAFSIANLIFHPFAMERINQFADEMAKSPKLLPKCFHNDKDACRALLLKAGSLNMDPFSIGAHGFIQPNGTIGFEAKVFQAIAESASGIIFSVVYEGNWENVIGKTEERTGQNGKYRAPIWKPQDEIGLKAIITGKWPNGRVETLDVYMSECHPRFSTNWANDPRLQTYYAGLKKFLRRFAPGLIMGIFDRDDSAIESTVIHAEKDVTPKNASDLNNMFSSKQSLEQPKTAQVIEQDETQHPNEIYNRSVNRSSNDLDNEQDFGMTKHEEIKAMIATAKDRDGYREVVKIYTAALTNDEITTDEAEEIKSSLTNLYNQLKKEPQQ